jgi:hypothetical protein
MTSAFSKVLPWLPLLLLSGCGSAAGPTYAPKLGTLNGTVTSNTSVATPAEVRVALVWSTFPTGGASFSLQMAQDVTVRAEFPAQFRLDLETLPPDAAMITPDPAKAAEAGASPGSRVALGALVVYDDVDGDGRLELIAPGASTSSDRVLGVAEDFMVLYFEGQEDDHPWVFEPSLRINRGYNLIGTRISPVHCPGVGIWARARRRSRRPGLFSLSIRTLTSRSRLILSFLGSFARNRKAAASAFRPRATCVRERRVLDAICHPPPASPAAPTRRPSSRELARRRLRCVRDCPANTSRESAIPTARLPRVGPAALERHRPLHRRVRLARSSGAV